MLTTKKKKGNAHSLFILFIYTFLKVYFQYQQTHINENWLKMYENVFKIFFSPR